MSFITILYNIKHTIYNIFNNTIKYTIYDLLNNTFKDIFKDKFKNTVTFVFEKYCPKCPEVINTIIKTIEINTDYNIINKLSWILTSRFILKLYSRFTLMEIMLLTDGVINSIYFIKDYLILVFSSKNLTRKVLIKSNEEIVKNYNSVYNLNLLD